MEQVPSAPFKDPLPPHDTVGQEYNRTRSTFHSAQSRSATRGTARHPAGATSHHWATPHRRSDVCPASLAHLQPEHLW